MDETYYTINEVAQKLKVTRKAVYDWMSQGKLAYETLGAGGRRRISQSALDAFLRRGHEDDSEKQRAANSLAAA